MIFKVLWRKGYFAFSVLFYFLFCAQSFSAPVTLENLNTHLNAYDSAQSFLNDSQGLLRYRELLKSYLQYDAAFDPIFDKTIEQMRVLVERVPGFAAQIWRQPAFDEKVISLEASKLKRSGIETILSGLDSKIEELSQIYEKEAKPWALSDEDFKNKIQNLSASITTQLEVLDSAFEEKIRKPSNTALKKFSKEDHSKRKEYLDRRKKIYGDNADYGSLKSFLKFKLISTETWRDRYRSPFAEDSVEALTQMARLERAPEVDEILSEFGIQDALSEGMKLHPDLQAQKTDEEFQKFKEVAKKINSLKAPPEPEALTEEVARLQNAHPELPPQEIYNRLSANSLGLLQNYRRDVRAVYDTKKRLVASLNQKIFTLPVVDSPQSFDLKLRDQSSKELVLKPVRAFHTAFAGRFNRECVGGGSCENLTPRRWALSALNGVKSFFAEEGSDFDGQVRLVPVLRRGCPIPTELTHPIPQC